MLLSAERPADPCEDSSHGLPESGLHATRKRSVGRGKSVANEELHQRGYLKDGKLCGTKFGEFEDLNIGGTSVQELKLCGVEVVIPDSVSFPFSLYKSPKTPRTAKPDRVFLRRQEGALRPVAVGEHKAPAKLRSPAQQKLAAEQGLFAAAALGARVAITANGERYFYIDVIKSLQTGEIEYLEEKRDLVPSVLSNILAGDAATVRDPKPLAESVWQLIWQATKEEPKACLLTFVEIFVLKFLSDNLPLRVLPHAFRFDALTIGRAEFTELHGTTEIEYYVDKIRPRIKQLFPDNTVVQDPAVTSVFDLNTLVSKTSVINGFAFLRSSVESLASFNRTFLEILGEFEAFGPLTTIDPQFKLRLYETFLRRSARQQKLGQFFTPRNVVRPMIRMARLDTLADGAVVLDPAAGVGGFVLEPPLVVPELADNVSFAKGAPIRKIKLIGADVDENTHVLAKANALIHFAEFVRNPAVTISAINRLLAETFVLMNDNETLGSLANPPVQTVDVILTNPPYVTRGSGVVKEEINEVGIGTNGRDLREYYDKAGLGVESLFLRYVVSALKPGGRAFVVVPLGLLNRTEPAPKEAVLRECNLLASIALPRNTFFNTAQLTYVLALEKRHTEADPRPPVFCALARTIGESLNWERVPTPHENDLADVAELFVQWDGTSEHLALSDLVKIVDSDEFTQDDRWDVARFWSEEERVALGLQDSAVSRPDFIEEVTSELEEITKELQLSAAELAALKNAPMRTLSLGDDTLFEIESGTRITNAQLRENPGELPIFSCFKNERIIKGRVSEDFWRSLGGVVEAPPFVTVNANGASIGRVYVRHEECGITDDVIAVRPKAAGVSVDYLGIALQDAVNAGRFIYEAKLFVGRVKELEVAIPVDENGEFSVTHQTLVAAAIRRFNALRTRLADLGSKSGNARTV
jgi:type I restriction enzyme M protein